MAQGDVNERRATQATGPVSPMNTHPQRLFVLRPHTHDCLTQGFGFCSAHMVGNLHVSALPRKTCTPDNHEVLRGLETEKGNKETFSATEMVERNDSRCGYATLLCKSRLQHERSVHDANACTHRPPSQHRERKRMFLPNQLSLWERSAVKHRFLYTPFSASCRAEVLRRTADEWMTGDLAEERTPHPTWHPRTTTDHLGKSFHPLANVTSALGLPSTADRNLISSSRSERFAPKLPIMCILWRIAFLQGNTLLW
jgi:hypothetical protein